jgi:hypothetical protein
MLEPVVNLAAVEPLFAPPEDRSAAAVLPGRGAVGYSPAMTETVALNVMDRVLEPLNRNLTAEAARVLAALRLDEAAQARMEELAAKNTEGRLIPDERAEYESWVSACDLVAILQAKARAWLTRARAV